MYWDNDASFKSEVGTSFNLNQVTEMGFTGGAGDDDLMAPPKPKMVQLMLVEIMRLTLMPIHLISETFLPSITLQVKNMILL